MTCLRALALWVVWNIPIGKFSPYLMAFALNSQAVRKPTSTDIEID